MSRKGMSSAKKENLDDIKKELSAAIALEPNYLLALIMSRKGMSSAKKENLDDIKKELSAAIALEPNYPDAYNLLGMTLSYAGEKKEAIDTLQKAVAMSPRNQIGRASCRERV